MPRDKTDVLIRLETLEKVLDGIWSVGLLKDVPGMDSQAIIEAATSLGEVAAITCRAVHAELESREPMGLLSPDPSVEQKLESFCR
jgi:hypothetical protein